MRLKIEGNTVSLKEELAELKAFMTREMSEFLAKQPTTDHTIAPEDCSKYKQAQGRRITSFLERELPKLKSEIVEEIRETLVERHYNLSDHVSQVTHSVESKILSSVSSNIKSEIDDLRDNLSTNRSSEIDDLKNILQPQLNSLWNNIKSEFNDLKHSLSANVTNKIHRMRREINDFRVSLSIIKPQVSSIANISQSLNTTLQGKLDKLKNSLLQTEASLASLTKKVEFLQLPTSCVEALQNGEESGIYKLYLPTAGVEPFEVYCLKDPENGPAWTMVQRRQDGSTDFYRSWEDYKNGFGDLQAEFFIGLEHLHVMTNTAKPQELWIELRDWWETTKYAKYSAFKIGNEASKYYLELGQYSGDAGNAMINHRKFSTNDADNDSAVNRSCAEIHKGAWWFGDCMTCHLNGEYLRGQLPRNDDNFDRGISWYNWHGSYYSLKYAHMAIRPSH